VLPFSDIDSRNALLNQLLGKPLPDKAIIHPPFHSTYGLRIALGERTSVGQACSFLDLGGITIGDRTIISPKVTLITEGHPIEPAERYGFITVAPIVIEADVWIGAAAEPVHAVGERIGHDSVVGAGAIVAKDVPPTVVTGAGYVDRKHLSPRPAQRYEPHTQSVATLAASAHTRDTCAPIRRSGSRSHSLVGAQIN
jgi:acetyltransferase-like isoleucine patch superfamily enzyme